MIKMEGLIVIGSFLKPHGLKGEIAIESTFDIDFREVPYVVAEVDGIPVPFFIDGYREKGATAYLLKIEGIDTAEDAAMLKGDVFIARDFRQSIANLDDDDFTYSELLGMSVINADGQTLGTLAFIDDTTANVLAYVKKPDNEEIIFPLANEFIEYIDVENRQISVNISPSLLSLND